jgi:uncharacterized protein YkwD
VLGAAVAVLLGMLGVGAALLPASFGGATGTTSSAGGLAGAAGTGGAEPLDARSVETESVPTTPPSPMATAPAPTARRSMAAPAPKAAPTRKTTPTPQRSPSPAAAPTTKGVSTQVDRVVAIVNAQRAANGCGAVEINTRLTTAAQLHSQDQAAHNTMSHTGSDGSTPWQRAERAGYQSAIGENVAYGYRTPEAVMDGWMNSSGHRANILNCQAEAIGVGIAPASDGTLYWTQMFGSTV